MGEVGRSAGPVSEFLAKLQEAQWSDVGIETPCGDCDLCCKTLEVTIEGDEHQALSAFEPSLLHEFRSGNASYWTIIKNADGSCPKLVDGQCSIWSHRPRMCKRFDCRIFALAELEPPATEPSLAERIASWTFSVDQDVDEEQLLAFQRALQLINHNRDTFARRGIEAGSVKAASLAVDLRHLFVSESRAGETDLLALALKEVRSRLEDLKRERNP